MGWTGKSNIKVCIIFVSNVDATTIKKGVVPCVRLKGRGLAVPRSIKKEGIEARPILKVQTRHHHRRSEIG